MTTELVLPLTDALGKLVRAGKFNTIDEIVDAIDQANAWPEGVVEAAQRRVKKAEARRLIRSLKDNAGWPLWASIEIEVGGHKQRAYAQEALFDLEMYKQVINYHKDRGIHHMATANEYARRCRQKLGAQMRLPFPNVG